MKKTRLRRLLEIVVLLQSGRGYNTMQLSVELGVSRRTIFRDLEELRLAGVPLQYYEEREQYRIVPEILLPPTSFAADEALSLLLLCRELGGADALPFLHAAKRAALKIESILPAKLRQYLGAASQAIRIRPEPRAKLDEQNEIYQALVTACARRRCVRIRYDSYTDNTQLVTKLSPYQLLFSRRAWYVIGRSSVHREIRTFHVGRIRELTPLDESFKLPRGFNLEQFLGNAWHLMSEPGPDRRVVIRFAPMVARNVAEVVWHKTQQVEFQSDGSCLFQVHVAGLTEISWWILGYGDQATVLEPPELREMIVAKARKMVQAYEEKRKAES